MHSSAHGLETPRSQILKHVLLTVEVAQACLAPTSKGVAVEVIV
jgi:hypothetical protein